MLEEKLWLLDDVHPTYGKVCMMAVQDGEALRFFIDKLGCISLIPLDVLNYKE